MNIYTRKHISEYVCAALYMATMYNVFGLQGFNTKTIAISCRSI